MLWTKIRSYWGIFLCAFSMRLYFLAHSFFLYDESKFFAVIRDLVEGLYFPRLGPPITVEGAYIPGGFFFYFMSLSQVFGSSVFNVYIMMSFLSSLSIVFFFDFIKTKWGESAAWIAGLFLCASPWMVFYNITLWNPNLLYLFLAVSLWLTAKLEQKWTPSYFIFLCVLLGLFPQIHLSAIAFWIGFIFLLWPILRSAPRHELKKAYYWIFGLLVLFYFPYLTIEIKMKFANTYKILFGVAGRDHSWSAVFFPLYLLRFYTHDLSYFNLHGFHQALPEWKAFLSFLFPKVNYFWYGFTWSVFLFSLFIFIKSIVLIFQAKSRWFYAFFLFIGVHFLLLLISKKQIFPHYFNSLIFINACFLGVIYTTLKNKNFKKLYLVFFVSSVVFGLNGMNQVTHDVFSTQSIGLKHGVIEKLIEVISTEQGEQVWEVSTKPIEVGIFKSENEPSFFMQPEDQSLSILAKRVYGKKIDFKFLENHQYNLLFIRSKTIEDYPEFLDKFIVLNTLFTNNQVSVFLVSIKEGPLF